MFADAYTVGLDCRSEGTARSGTLDTANNHMHIERNSRSEREHATSTANFSRVESATVMNHELATQHSVHIRLLEIGGTQ